MGSMVVFFEKAKIMKKRNSMASSVKMCIFAGKKPNIIRIMTTMQMHAELYRAMGEIADDKALLEMVLAFVKSLVPKKKRNVKEVDDNEKLEAALAKFSGDWGGDETPEKIAEELRQGVENQRTVEVW